MLDWKEYVKIYHFTLNEHYKFPSLHLFRNHIKTLIAVGKTL